MVYRRHPGPPYRPVLLGRSVAIADMGNLRWSKPKARQVDRMHPPVKSDTASVLVI